VNKPDHLQINRDNLEAKHASKEVHDGENRKEWTSTNPIHWSWATLR